jgi:hypothetical protein
VQPLVTTLQAVTVSSLSKTQFEKVTTVDEPDDSARWSYQLFWDALSETACELRVRMKPGQLPALQELL